MKLTCYSPPNPDHWKGRLDGGSVPLRFHEVVECLDVSQAGDLRGSIAFVGFACDAGVCRNLGRPGATQGPQALRKALAKIPIHLKKRLVDVGDINCFDDNLEASQAALGDLVHHLLSVGSFPVVLGGGHEVAWGHYQGVASAYPQSRIGVINFDAHFDLRPLVDGHLGSSGTSFLQIAQDCQARGIPFDYLCLGIQRFSNTQVLFDTAKQLNVTVISAEAIQQEAQGSILAKIDQFVASCEKLYVTVCMDVFAAAFAPGVSAPQPLGLEPKSVLPLLRHLASSGKVAGFDLAEVSPPLDRDELTSSLGAVLIAEVIHQVK